MYYLNVGWIWIGTYFSRFPTFARSICYVCILVAVTYKLRMRIQVAVVKDVEEVSSVFLQRSVLPQINSTVYVLPSQVVLIDVLAWRIMTMRRNAFLSFLKGIRDGNCVSRRRMQSGRLQGLLILDMLIWNWFFFRCVTVTVGVGPNVSDWIIYHVFFSIMLLIWHMIRQFKGGSHFSVM